MACESSLIAPPKQNGVPSNFRNSKIRWPSPYEYKNLDINRGLSKDSLLLILWTLEMFHEKGVPGHVFDKVDYDNVRFESWYFQG